MRTETVLKYFSGDGDERKARAKIADALGLHVSASYQWGEFVPEVQALRLREWSDKALDIDPHAPYAKYYLK